MMQEWVITIAKMIATIAALTLVVALIPKIVRHGEPLPVEAPAQSVEHVQAKPPLSQEQRLKNIEMRLITLAQLQQRQLDLLAEAQRGRVALTNH